MESQPPARLLKGPPTGARRTVQINFPPFFRLCYWEDEYRIMEAALDVAYIKQDTPTPCWKAGYKMMLRWTHIYESLADQFPHDKDMQERGILDSELGPCRRRLGLAALNWNELSAPKGLANMLQQHGPIWAAGYRASDFSVKDKPDFKHVVVIRGVKTHLFREPEVFVK